MARFLQACALVILGFWAAGAQSGAFDDPLRFVTTTSVRDSGLLDYLLPKFPAAHPGQVTTTVAGSGKALRMARNGQADVVLVHAPAAERKFVEDGYSSGHRPVMRNDFVIVGPAEDPAGVTDSTDVIEALRRIAASGSIFVSRGDDSGTNKKELTLWEQAGVQPYAKPWYLEAGSGMAQSLRLAELEKAYLLIDRATYLVQRQAGTAILLQDPARLYNPYSVIAVNPHKVAGVNARDAATLVDWLTSPAGQAEIAAYQHQGQRLFFPASAR